MEKAISISESFFVEKVQELLGNGYLCSTAQIRGNNASMFVTACNSVCLHV